MAPTFSFINYADSIKDFQEKGTYQESDPVAILSAKILESSSKSIAVLDFMGLENIGRSSDQFEEILCSAINGYENKFGKSLPLILINIDDQNFDAIANERVLNHVVNKGCLIPVFGEYGNITTIIGADNEICPAIESLFIRSDLEEGADKLRSYSGMNVLLRKNGWLIKESDGSYDFSFSEDELINDIGVHIIKHKLDAIQPGHYRLLSGKHVLDYISSAALFTKPKYTSWFARVIFSRFRRKSIDYIVSYSDQTLTLALELKREFEKQGVTIECLSMVNYDNPRLKDNPPHYNKVKGKKALILTDVTSTGGLLERMSNAIKSQGGIVQGLASVVEENAYNGPLKKLFYSLSQYHIELYDPDDKMSPCPACKSPDKKELYVINPRTNTPSPMRDESEYLEDIASGYEPNRRFWKMVQDTDALRTHALFQKRHYYYYIDTQAVLKEFINEIDWHAAINRLYGDKELPGVLLFPENPSARMIAHHIGANMIPSASQVAVKVKAEKYTTGDDIRLLAGKDILIVDDGANTGKTLNGIINLCARTDKKTNSQKVRIVKVCIFVDRLIGEYRETLMHRIGQDNMESIYRIPISSYINDRESCPLCTEVSLLTKHYELMSIEAKTYIDNRLEKIREKELSQYVATSTKDRNRSRKSTFQRAKMLDVLYQKGDLAFLEALSQKTPFEKLFRVLDAIPAEYIQMKDIKEWLTDQFQNIKDGGQLTKFIRMWLKIAPEEIIEHLYCIAEQFAKLGRNLFLAYMLEWLILENLLSKDKASDLLNSILNNSPEHAPFIVRMQESVVFKYPFQIRLRPTLKTIYDNIILKAAKTDVNVLITGETGTGKGILARILHEESKGATKPYKIVNVSSFSETLMESELFGHEKGAFTGATTQKAGKLEAADGGTAFFDEISEIPLHLQVKLLGVLDQKVFERVGGTEPVRPAFRLICATNKPLEPLVKAGKFREDLFYRIDVVRIDIPPLRSKPEEILSLAKYYMDFFCKEHGIEKLKYDEDEVEKLLISYQWPGNVRELKNVIEREVVLSNNEKTNFDFLREKINNTIKRDVDPDRKSFKERTDMAKKEIIFECLKRNGWNKTKAKKELDISWKHLNNLTKQFDISAP